jgi:hypothetical protein
VPASPSVPALTVGEFIWRISEYGRDTALDRVCEESDGTADHCPAVAARRICESKPGFRHNAFKILEVMMQPCLQCRVVRNRKPA